MKKTEKNEMIDLKFGVKPTAVRRVSTEQTITINLMMLMILTMMRMVMMMIRIMAMINKIDGYKMNQ